MKFRLLLTGILAFVAMPLFMGRLVSAMGYSFYDVPQNAWYAPYVSQGVDLGIATGYRDLYGNPTGYYGPGNPVTLAEALKMMMEAAGYDTSRGHGVGHWAVQYVSVAISEGINISFDPVLYLDRPATRAEVTSLVVDAFKKRAWRADTIVPERYTDVDSFDPAQHNASINILTQDGVTSGDGEACAPYPAVCPKTTFRPLAQINRAEAVKIALRARELYGTPGRRSSASSSGGSCTHYECGYAPAMANWLCHDGSIGGPSCERLPDGRCGWLIKQCSFSSSHSSSVSSSRSGSSQSSISSAPTSASSSRSSLSSSVSSSVSSRAAQSFSVLYSSSGFVPSSLEIRKGDTVTFRSQTSAGMWVASDPHPSHSEYPEFDMHASVGSGGTFVFTFGKVGTWGYHNHFDPSKKGSVVVTQ